MLSADRADASPQSRSTWGQSILPDLVRSTLQMIRTKMRGSGGDGKESLRVIHQLSTFGSKQLVTVMEYGEERFVVASTPKGAIAICALQFSPLQDSRESSSLGSEIGN